MSAASLTVHRCGFLEYDELSGLVSVASLVRVDSGHSVGVVALRVDGSLEVRPAPTLQVVHLVPGVGGDAAETMVTAVAAVQRDQDAEDVTVWVAGFDGRLVAWDPATREVQAVLDVGGGVIWDLALFVDADKGLVRLATATEDGRVRIFDASAPESPGQLTLLSTSQRANERCLSLCWAPCGTIIYAGDGDGQIRKLEQPSGRPLTTLTITDREDPALVWSLALVGDGKTLVAGDSRGLVSIWDTVLGTAAGTMGGEYHIEALAGDITALVPTADGKAVFVGAANGGVGALRQENDAHGEWSVHRARLIHATDVRTMCQHNNKIVVGGLDGRISVVRPKKFFEEAPVKRLFPVARNKVSLVNSKKRTILSRHGNHVDLWSLSSPREKAAPRLLLRVTPRLLGGPIVSSAMDGNHSVLVVSGPDRTRAFTVQAHGDREVTEGAQIMVDPIQRHPEGLENLSEGFSAGESDPLLCVCQTGYDGMPEFLGISKNGASCLLMAALNCSFGIVAKWRSDDLSPQCGRLIHCSACPGGERLAITDGRYVFILSRKLGFADPVGYLAIGERDPARFIVEVSWETKDTFALVTADNRVKLYNCQKGGDFKETELTFESDESLTGKRGRIACRPEGVRFAGHSRLVVYGHDFVDIYSSGLAHSGDQEPRSSTKRKRKRTSSKRPAVFRLSNVQNVVGAISFDDEILVADCPWRTAVARLPPAIPKKQFL